MNSRHKNLLSLAWNYDSLNIRLRTGGPRSQTNVHSPQQIRVPWPIQPASLTDSGWQPVTRNERQVPAKLSACCCPALALPSGSCTPWPLSRLSCLPPNGRQSNPLPGSEVPPQESRAFSPQYATETRCGHRHRHQALWTP